MVLEHVRTTDVRELPERLVPFLAAARQVGTAVLATEPRERREAVLYLQRRVSERPEVHALRCAGVLWWLRHEHQHATGRAAADSIEQTRAASPDLLPIVAVPPTGEVLVHWVRARWP